MRCVTSRPINVNGELFDDLMTGPSSETVCSPCDTGSHERCRQRGCACGCTRPAPARVISEPYIPPGTLLDEERVEADPLSVACQTCRAAAGAPCTGTSGRGVHVRRWVAACRGDA